MSANNKPEWQGQICELCYRPMAAGKHLDGNNSHKPVIREIRK